MATEVITKAEKLLIERVNWNYVGIVSGVLSALVAVYNIFEYTKVIRAKKNV